MSKIKGDGENKPFLDEQVFIVLLHKSGLSMAELASKVGYSAPAAIKNLLQGRNKPPMTKTEKMAQILGCYPSTLLITPDKVDQQKREVYTAHRVATRKAFTDYEERKGNDEAPADKMTYNQLLAEFQRLGAELEKIKEN